MFNSEGYLYLSKEFTKKATLSDILFLLYCMIYPYFLKPIIIFIFIFSNIALFYMYLVIMYKPSAKGLID